MALVAQNAEPFEGLSGLYFSAVVHLVTSFYFSLMNIVLYFPSPPRCPTAVKMALLQKPKHLCHLLRFLGLCPITSFPLIGLKHQCCIMVFDSQVGGTVPLLVSAELTHVPCSEGLRPALDKVLA